MVWRDDILRSSALNDLSKAAHAGAIDLEHLSRCTLGNQVLQHEVLALFREQSEIYLRHLQDASDAEAWADAAHSLKGSARSVGAMDVAWCAEAAEQLSHELRDASRREAMQELRRLVDRANRFIDGMLADTKSGM